jgi:hypothetical protein|nr:MAG TPA: Protein of unknown function (DUF1642) [Caudoviricetes sp.]
MNKQEALKRIEVQKETLIRLTGWAVYVYIEELIKSLDEPQKVKVPQLVAEKIEYFKKSGDWDLFQAMDYMFGEKEIKEWLEDKDNQETFARAWLDGYEVEEEKRYEVILCNGQSLKTVYRQGGDHLDFEMVYGDLESFTRKRLEEAGFGWVFDCPGIEIEEVE